MRGRGRDRAGQAIPADVLARAAEAARQAQADQHADGVPVPNRATRRPPQPVDLRRTLIFAALAFAVIVTVVVNRAVGTGTEPYSEDAFTLPPFESSGPPRHDRSDEVVVERFERIDATTVRIAGWAASTDRVEVIGGGDVVATIPITEERLDTAAAAGLASGFVGFDETVTVASADVGLCVTRPGQLPSPEACDRPILDMDTHRVVAFYGVPYEPPLGTLGEGAPEDVLARLQKQAAPYEMDTRPVMLAFEIIVTVAQAGPGSDGNYSAAIGTDDVVEFMEVIRGAGGVTLIDFQTGRDRYLDQIPDYLDLIRQPDVHIALDPEWDMEEGEVPNEVIGSSEASEINEVMNWLAEIIRTERLPRKVVVVHNFTEGMIRDRDLLDPPPEIDLVIHMDGHGPPQNKIGVYDRLKEDAPLFNGFKVFYQRDIPLMTPEAVLTLDPAFISYQ